MPVSRGSTISENKVTAVTSNLDFSHTVDANTTLLLLYVGVEGNEAVDETTLPPQWSLGGGENLTLISDSGSTGSNSDCRSYWFGLINPTTGAGTIRVRTTSDVNPAWCAAVNYLSTVATSVADATNVLSTDNNTGATSTAVHASAGTAGNALIFGGHFQGQDGSPASNATSFTEVFDTTTGGSNSQDFACYIAELLDAAPEAITVTWGSSDENCSIYIEVVATVPVGAISATAPLAFGGTADLKATGKLDATAALVFSGTADLKATGKLDAATTLTFSAPTANLGGIGVLDATAALTFGAPTVDLKARGKLDATAALVFSAATALLQGTGILAATAALAFSATADLTTASAQISATAALAFTQTADLKGTGKLDATTALIFSATTDLKADGKLDATSLLVFSAAANLKGLGKLDASSALVLSATANLKGQGKLDAAPALAFSTTANLTNATQGDVSATAAMVFSASANLVDSTPPAVQGFYHSTLTADTIGIALTGKAGRFN